MGVIGPSRRFSLGDIPGYQQGFITQYSTSTQVTISPGRFECDGVSFHLASTAHHNMTSLLPAFGIHYIYLDKSASTPESPVFYDTTTAPLDASAIFGGWYHTTNTVDRLVGVVISPSAGGATILPFTCQANGSNIRYVANLSLATLAAAQPLTGNWATPNYKDADVVTPTSATELLLSLTNRDTTAEVSLYATNKENGDVEPNIGLGIIYWRGYASARDQGWLALGASRKIYIAGATDDDNQLGASAIGFGYRR